jgi:hypothetical protein
MSCITHPAFPIHRDKSSGLLRCFFCHKQKFYLFISGCKYKTFISYKSKNAKFFFIRQKRFYAVNVRMNLLTVIFNVLIRTQGRVMCNIFEKTFDFFRILKKLFVPL